MNIYKKKSNNVICSIRNNRIIYSVVIVIFLCIIIVALERNLSNYGENKNNKYSIENFRNMYIEEGSFDLLKGNIKNTNLLLSDITSYIFLKNGFKIKKDYIGNDSISKNIIDDYLSRENYENYANQFKTFIDDLKYFPVPYSENSKNGYVNYQNSWGNERLYGGERKHEGTDIMGDKNIRNYYPVISITDGVVENLGWLELGGYRVGIRSIGGGYFYYAHLATYYDGLKEGDVVKAGQLIGFMGDTGYSKVEGTTGNFDVHLHVGIYLNIDNQEISINPYYILKNLKILYYNY